MVHDVQGRALAGVKPREVGKRQRAQRLTHTIRAVVEAHQHIAVAHWRNGKRIGANQHHRFHELVIDAGVVRLLYGGKRIGDVRCLTFYRRVVPQRGALPSVVAVHAVVPAAHRGEHRATFTPLQCFAQKFEARFWWRVAAIQQRMQGDILHALTLYKLQQTEQMLVVRMHAAVAQQSKQVQCATTLFRARTRCNQCGICEKTSVVNRCADAHQVPA